MTCVIDGGNVTQSLQALVPSQWYHHSHGLLKTNVNVNKFKQKQTFRDHFGVPSSDADIQQHLVANKTELDAVVATYNNLILPMQGQR